MDKNKKSIWLWVLGIALVLLSISLPYIPSALTEVGSNRSITLNTDKPGEIGDAIGGTTAPFIGVAGLLITFLAFWIQYKANLQQREDIKIERFENKFYELLRIHNDNVAQMKIKNDATDRKCFVRMYYEFKFLKLLIDKINEKEELCISESVRTNLAYVTFFNGVGLESDEAADYFFQNTSKNEEKLLSRFRAEAKKIQMFYSINTPKAYPMKSEYFTYTVNEVKSNIVIEVSLNKTDITWQIYYYPFDGHMQRLGHYYRHLFQTVKYIVRTEVFKHLDVHKERQVKLAYLKTLRAQLSNHEQLMLYFNALSAYGKEWIKNEYLTEYYMIKNIPLALIDFTNKPEELKVFQKYLRDDIEGIKVFVKEEVIPETGSKILKSLFEWQEDDLEEYLKKKSES